MVTGKHNPDKYQEDTFKAAKVGIVMLLEIVALGSHCIGDVPCGPGDDGAQYFIIFY